MHEIDRESVCVIRLRVVGLERQRKEEGARIRCKVVKDDRVNTKDKMRNLEE